MFRFGGRLSHCISYFGDNVKGRKLLHKISVRVSEEDTVVALIDIQKILLPIWLIFQLSFWIRFYGWVVIWSEISCFLGLVSKKYSTKQFN